MVTITTFFKTTDVYYSGAIVVLVFTVTALTIFIFVLCCCHAACLVVFVNIILFHNFVHLGILLQHKLSNCLPTCAGHPHKASQEPIVDRMEDTPVAFSLACCPTTLSSTKVEHLQHHVKCFPSLLQVLIEIVPLKHVFSEVPAFH